MRLESICPKCNKHKAVKQTLRTAKGFFNIFECGHTTVEAFKVTAPLERDEKWEQFYEYQKQGVKAAERANFRMLIGDEMGLGKTIQALGCLRYNYEITTPALIVCPASLTYKWQREFKIWFNDRFNTYENAPLIHTNSDGFLLSGQKIFILSAGILMKPTLVEAIKEYGFKTLIVDECHFYKNDKSSRTKALLEVAKEIPNRILLSGTSVMNNTGEYFNSLHLVRPEHWPNRGYLYSYCTFDRTGKPLGLSNTRKDLFFEKTKDYVIRRTKSQVLPDLPEKRVNYQFVSLREQKTFITAYNKIVDELEELLNHKKSNMDWMGGFMGIMANLRHIVGIAKIPLVAEEVISRVLYTEDKLCVGIHHKLVMSKLRDLLFRRFCYNCKQYFFGDYCEVCEVQLSSDKVIEPLHISDEFPEIKDSRCDRFRKDPLQRVLLASILGCGIGRDLEFCPTALVVEREWNRALEAQFEGRFHRIGTLEKVTIDYLMAEGTIDEYFHEMVLLKEKIQDSILEKDLSSDSYFMIELAERIVNKRLKYVGM